MDEARVQELMGQMVGYMTGGAVCFGVWVGDELGLYRAMAGVGSMRADEVASATGCNPRLVREWLDGQAAAGLIGYDPAGDAYELSEEAALALADDTAPVFVARAMNALGSFFMDIDKVTAAFRGDAGVTTTPACSPARSGSSAPATAPSCPAPGFPRWTAWSPSCTPAPKSPTSGVVTARPSW
jgi:hypothetical protein